MNLLDFADHEYINLITYKKDNTSVKTPVWVAEHDDYLVITSSKSAGKVKRINKPYARKIQILTVVEQRSKAAGKREQARIAKRCKLALKRKHGKK